MIRVLQARKLGLGLEVQNGAGEHTRRGGVRSARGILTPIANFNGMNVLFGKDGASFLPVRQWRNHERSQKNPGDRCGRAALGW
jgi:hypothetical protein